MNQGDKVIKTKITMKSLIGNLLFVSVLLLIFTRFLSVSSGTPFPLDIITSDSMAPSLMEGDLIAWTPANIEDVEVGDVIVFKSLVSWPDERLVAHRVIEIQESFGKPALMTKGDANEWNDQSGPHIPEPYITERNFVGKVLSIGTQPLKVPFIGVIGIWVNQAFTLLSQPSAAKGTVTYIGVFTPLTISVILLVISLFILPEKVKTVKEKLRVLILGTQALNLKNVFMFFLMIFIILLVLMHFFAYDSISSSIGVGEFPEKSNFELGSLIPGETTKIPRELPIINPGIMPVKGFLFGTRDLTDYVNRRSFDIEPGMVKQIGVTATIPNGTQYGAYDGDIMIYSPLVHHP